MHFLVRFHSACFVHTDCLLYTHRVPAVYTQSACWGHTHCLLGTHTAHLLSRILHYTVLYFLSYSGLSTWGKEEHSIKGGEKDPLIDFWNRGEVDWSSGEAGGAVSCEISAG